MVEAALGFRAHSGWAAMAAVAGSLEAPLVILRRRVELADRRVSGSVQPYHAAKEMHPNDAEAFINSCARDAKAKAEAALRKVIFELDGKGAHLVGACVLSGSGRLPADLAAALASHPMIHTAEGEFFRDALRKACESCSLPVSRIREKELLPLEPRVSGLGKTLGPPWRKDEKLCAIAGWMVLTRAAP